MNQLTAVLRLTDEGLSQRQTAASCDLGQAAASGFRASTGTVGLHCEDIAKWTDGQLPAAVGVASPLRAIAGTPMEPVTAPVTNPWFGVVDGSRGRSLGFQLAVATTWQPAREGAL